MLWVENPDTKERLRVVRGKLRDRQVRVGRHVPPAPDELNAFLKRFVEGYSSSHLSRLRKVIGVAASHHRLAWIHPFLDGNGRVPGCSRTHCCANSTSVRSSGRSRAVWRGG
jgi:Fic family protein